MPVPTGRGSLGRRLREEGSTSRSPRVGVDGFELTVFAALAGLSLWVLGLDLWQVVVNGRSWTGTDGLTLADQMQYLAWIHDASRHVLVSNLFVISPTPADYFQPVVAISGGLTAVGVAPWLALLVWKPVAVGGVFIATRAYVHRIFEDRWARRAALVLGVFFGWVAITKDLWLGLLSWSWGYPYGLIALAAMLAALVAYERDRAANRLGWAPALFGALTSSLHPWQGETLILCLVGAEVLMWGAGERLGIRSALVTIFATGLPLCYYGVLDLTDLSWTLGKEVERGAFPLWMLALGIAPLAMPAMLAYRTRPRTFMASVTRTWPIAAFAVYMLSTTRLGSNPLHALLGITVPLGVLAVEGVRAVSWRPVFVRREVLGAVAVVAVTVPTTLNELRTAHRLVAPRAGNANFVAHDERAALDYLARDPEPGGVISRFYLGTVVPAETGRRTFVGNCVWSQGHCSERMTITDELFLGLLPTQASRAVALTSGARFLLADCRSHADLRAVLGDIISAAHRFGCATVYVIKRGLTRAPGAERSAMQATREAPSTAARPGAMRTQPAVPRCLDARTASTTA